MKIIARLLPSIALLFVLLIIRTNQRVYAAPSSCSGSCPPGWACSSFLPGTQIATGSGLTANIENLKIGDSILSFDETLGLVQTSTIRQIIYGARNEYYKITANKKSVSASANHPFYVGGGYKSWDPLVTIGYKRADELVVGDIVYILNRSVIEPVKLLIFKIHWPGERLYIIISGDENFCEQLCCTQQILLPAPTTSTATVLSDQRPEVRGKQVPFKYWAGLHNCRADGVVSVSRMVGAGPPPASPTPPSASMSTERNQLRGMFCFLRRGNPGVQ